MEAKKSTTRQVSQKKIGRQTQKSSNFKMDRGSQNREFAVITYIFLGLFLLMMGYFVYFQVFRSEEVINSPYNRRQDNFAEHVVRGAILSADGKTLAETLVDDSGNEMRYYPYGSMFAHAVGYDGNGRSGMESFANFSLLRSHAFFLEQLVNGLQDEKNIGDNVVSTLRYDLQEAAYQALGDYNGAIVALDPETGQILAMVSKPDYNPNTILENWDSIVSDENNSSLVNRVTQGLYPPGSTFKIFTTLAYVGEHPNYAEYSFDCTGSIMVEDYELHCAGNSVHGQESLIDSFANSCNGSYATLGLSLNKSSLSKLCDSLLFHTDLPVQYPSSQSQFQLSDSSTAIQVAQTAIGQGDTLMTPMHLALVTSAIANDGVLMRPYVIDHTENYQGVTVRNYRSSIYSTLLTTQQASLLQEFMAQVVLDGTGSALSGAAYTVAGKTGSAEYSSNKDASHAWFTGYASDDSHGTIVVTVIVEDGGSGSRTAVPIAKSIFDTFFQ